MTRKRVFGSVAVAIVTVGLSAAVTMPAAHADPLDPIRGAVNGARAQSACGPLNYSIELEGEAQFAIGNNLPGVPPAGKYNGERVLFKGSGDPESQAQGRAVGAADGAIKDCKYKDFGVGFIRDEGNENDTVSIVLGVPAAPAKPADVQCPAGSETPTVPAGQQCKPAKQPDVQCPPGSPVPSVPAGQTCPAAEAAPTNAVTLDFQRSGLQLKANFKNSSKVPAQCHYDAEPAGGTAIGSKTDDFGLGANATVTRTYAGPPIASTYHVVVSCTGSFNGQNVEIGHIDQNFDF